MIWIFPSGEALKTGLEVITILSDGAVKIKLALRYFCLRSRWDCKQAR